MDAVALNLTSSQKNPDVEAKASRLVQNWAQIAEARPGQMDYITETYERLKRANVTFPPLESINTAMVETLTAPEWSDSEVCARCRTSFTTFNRKHHCRNCGNVFCQQCSSSQLALPWYGITQPVRVCQACYGRGAPPKAPAKLPSSASSSSTKRRNSAIVPPSGRGGAGSHHRSNTIAAGSSVAGSNRRRAKEDEDLELAIKLSLESSGASSSGSRPGYVPSKPSGEGRATKQPNGRMLEGTDADDDPDLAAAIAASLRDYAPPQPSAPDGLHAPVEEGRLKTPRPDESGLEGQRLPLPPSLELPATDVDALLTFSQSIASQEAYARQYGQWPPNTNQQHMQSQYEKATSARPRMARSLEEGNRRHGVLVSMHDKLAEAVKLYDQLLDAQMSRPAYPYYGQQQQQQAPPAQVQGGYYGHEGYPSSSSMPAAAAGPSLYPSLAQQQQQQQQPMPAQATPLYGGHPAQLSTGDLRMPPSRSNSVTSYGAQGNSPLGYHAFQQSHQHSGPTFPHMHHQMQQLYQAQTPSEASYAPTPNPMHQQAAMMGGPYFGQAPPHRAPSYGAPPLSAMDSHSQTHYWQALQTLPPPPSSMQSQQQPDAPTWANQVNVPTHEPGQPTAPPQSISSLGSVPSMPHFGHLMNPQQQNIDGSASSPHQASSNSETTLSNAMGHLSMQSPSSSKPQIHGPGQGSLQLSKLQPTGPSHQDVIDSPAQSDDSGWRDIPISSALPPSASSTIAITPTAPPSQQQQQLPPTSSNFTSSLHISSPSVASPHSVSQHQHQQPISSPGGPAQQWASTARPVESSLIDL